MIYILGWTMWATMILQVTWSFIMGAFDLYLLTLRRGHLLNTTMLECFYIFNSLVERVTLLGTSAIAGAIIFYTRNIGFCSYLEFACRRMTIILSLAFIVSIFNVIFVAMLHRVCRQL